MKRMRKHIKRIRTDKKAVLLFVFGIIIGFLIAIVFKNTYQGNLIIIPEVKKDNVLVDYGILLKMVLNKNFKTFLILCLFAITTFGIYIMAFYMIYSGFVTGFVITLFLFKYGIKGMILFLSFVFPQYIIYIPVFLLTMAIGYKLCYNMYYSGRLNNKSKKTMILEKIPVFIVLIFLLFAGSLTEVYLNTALIKRVLLMF